MIQQHIVTDRVTRISKWQREEEGSQSRRDREIEREIERETKKGREKEKEKDMREMSGKMGME